MSKCVQSYGALISKINELNDIVLKEKLRSKWLVKETEIQARVISQLKSLLSINQTKRMCMLGHRSCNIDHLKYNLVVKNYATSRKQENPVMKNLAIQNSSKCPRTDCSWISKICRVTDKLQSSYSAPPTVVRNLVEDGVDPEFSSIWENVFAINQHIAVHQSPKTFIQNNSKFKAVDKYPKKDVYHNRSVILESNPFKFDRKKTTKKPKPVPKDYEPMTDAQLAKALSMDERELAEAFGYHDTVVNEKFEDDEYAVDTEGLHLVDDCELTGGSNFHNIQANVQTDLELAAAHGYYDETDVEIIDNIQSMCQTDMELAAAHGYGIETEVENLAAAHGHYDGSDTSLDDDELAAAFGYGSCRSNITSADDADHGASETVTDSSGDSSNSDDGSGDSASCDEGYDATDGTTDDDDYHDTSVGSAEGDDFSSSSG